MFKIPRLKSSFRIGFLNEDTAILVAENTDLIVQGKLQSALLMSLNNGWSSDEIADSLAREYGLAEVYYGLEELENTGIVEECNGLASRDSVFWGLMGIDSGRAIDRMAQCRVAVASTCGSASELVETLRLSGFHGAAEAALSQPGLGDRDITIVVAEDYLDPQLERFNAHAVACSHPWVLIKSTGAQVWTGPLFKPGETGCWHCLAERLRSNREVEEFIRSKTGDQARPIFPVGALPSAGGVAENLLTVALAKLFAGETPSPLVGKILTFDCKTMEFSSHVVTRIPHCPVCGNGKGVKPPHPQPPSLVSREKRFRLDGGHRILSPEVTFERFRKHISRITGIMDPLSPWLSRARLDHYRKHVNRIKGKVTPLTPLSPQAGEWSEDSGWASLKVYRTNYASIRKAHEAEDLKKGIRSGASAGKGLTDIQAKTGCLCEAIERVSGIYRGTEYRIRAAYHEVQDQAIHPHELLFFSEKQYRERDTWNAMNRRHTWVPTPFDEDREIDWSPVWSITNQVWKLAPTAFLYFGYESPVPETFCFADSNGNAAGNCLEEAIFQGLMELIERDAVALWWYNMIPMPAVDLDEMRDPRIVQFREAYRNAGRDIWVLDISSDLDAHVFVGVSVQSGGTRDRPIMGYGAHLDPKIAFTRALTEMSLSLGVVDVPSGVPFDEVALIASKQFTEETRLDEHLYLRPAADRPLRSFSGYADTSSEDLLDDLTRCVNTLASQGLEVLVHDLTRPDLGLNAVKVLVPGLRHMWPRYAPGRLFQAPVRLGWLDLPRSEEELNPLHLSQ